MSFTQCSPSALTSTMRANEAHLGLKPYIEFRTHPLANIMSKFLPPSSLVARSSLIQYQRLLSMDGRAPMRCPFELTLID
ncbi:Uncharacterised protein [Klebsiella pneumoniae subsp. pneumoniae]|nr:Uncharacterised protein [Klebsiella pneumoniae subsp. pneumoniae]